MNFMSKHNAPFQSLAVRAMPSLPFGLSPDPVRT